MSLTIGYAPQFSLPYPCLFYSSPCVVGCCFRMNQYDLWFTKSKIMFDWYVQAKDRAVCFGNELAEIRRVWE